MDLKSLIRDIPDFPRKGILFKDLTTLWRDPAGLKECVDRIAERYRGRGITRVVGAESRGFIIGAPLAYALGAGFVPARKPGKLPGDHLTKTYELEYGQAELQLHTGALEKGEKVLVIDDLLATGGTAKAMVDLVQQMGAEIVEAAFIVELEFLKGKDLLGVPVYALLKY